MVRQILAFRMSDKRVSFLHFNILWRYFYISFIKPGPSTAPRGRLEFDLYFSPRLRSG